MGEYLKELKARAKQILGDRAITKSFKKRNGDMPCLLCKSSPASKTKSHIIPKFLGKDIFGEKGEGYNISSAKMEAKPTIVQNTPTEDYILCPPCEDYFSLLETYFSANLYCKLWDSTKQDSFKLSKPEEGVVLLE